MDRWNVGILIFDGVEVLDFAGPFEVFSRTRLVPGSNRAATEDSAPFNVFTVAGRGARDRDRGPQGPSAAHGFATRRSIDLLVVPGGFGTRRLLEDRDTRTGSIRTAAAARSW